ncbi:MAG TPA: enoyl-CoA hydratase-related protein, partial [Afipia sp.]
MSVHAARAPSPQPPILLREMVGNIAVLTLNRPAARNSLSTAMIAGLHAAFDEVGSDKAVRAVVL